MVINPLNPAAGDVPVPEDPRELEAALRAGPVTYRMFPYVQWRYGERGRKFTESDSAWLAWLVRHEQSHVNEQVLWLRSVLSNRGMPGWILETHLVGLFKQLVRSIPERRAAYEKLISASELLSQQRETIMSHQVWVDLADEFAIAVERTPTPFTTGVGRLLVAAVIDERLGELNAVSSLEKWISDVERWREIKELRRSLSPHLRMHVDSAGFVVHWNDALLKTVNAARAAKRG